MANDRTPFDPAYYRLFSHPKMVRDLLVHFVKESWVADIDFNTLETLNPKFVTDYLRKRESDIIWRAKWHDRDIYLILFLEFQSTIDRFIAVRLQAYINLLHLEQIAQNQIKTHLPPVFPMVLYNGDAAWHCGHSTDMLLSPQCPDSLKPFQPRLKFWLIDEKRVPLNSNFNDDNLVEPLFAFEQVKKPGELLNVFHRFKSIIKAPQHAELREAFSLYLQAVLKVEENSDAITVKDLDEVENMLANKLEQWLEESRIEGRKEGHIKGKEEGLIKGKEEGRKETAIAIAINLLIKGIDREIICQVTGLSESDLQKLSETVKS